MKQLTLLVLGGNGRIGRVLQQCWEGDPGGMSLRWQARQRSVAVQTQGQALGARHDWRIFSPLSDAPALRDAALGCDALLCLAGAVPGRSADLEDNSRLALAAVRAAAEARSRFDRGRPARVLLASSAAVYGAAPGPLHEDMPLQPTHPYGQAKARMEDEAARLGQALGVPVTALRIGNIAGLDAILGGWRPGFCLDQFANGQVPRRSYIGVQTLAQVLAALCQRSDLPAVLNIAQPAPVAMDALLQAAGLSYVTAPAPQGAIAEVALDVTRLIGLLQPRLELAPARPEQMVAQWRQIQTDTEEQTPS